MPSPDDVVMRIVIEDDAASKAPSNAGSFSTGQGNAGSHYVVVPQAAGMSAQQTIERLRSGGRSGRSVVNNDSVDPITGQVHRDWGPTDPYTGSPFMGAAEVAAGGKNWADRMRDERDAARKQSQSWTDRLRERATNWVSRRTGIRSDDINAVNSHFSAKDAAKGAEAEYDAGTGAWTMAGNAVKPPGWATGAAEGASASGGAAAAGGAAEMIGGAGEAVTGAIAAVIGSELAGPFIGIAAAAVAASYGLKRFSESALARAEEISGYSSEISGAMARQTMRETRSDLREANALGGSYSNLMDSYGELVSELRELLLPIRKAITELLTIAANDFTAFIKAAKLFMIAIEAVLGPQLSTISAIAKSGQGAAQILAPGVMTLLDLANRWFGEKETELPSLLDDFLKQTSPAYEYGVDPLVGGSKLPMNIPAFAGI